MTDPLKLAEEIEEIMRGAYAPPWAACGDLILTERAPAGHDAGGVVICEGFDRGFADMRRERDAILAVMNRLSLIAAALRLAEADCALMDHDDSSVHRAQGEMQAWSDERDLLIEHHADAEAAYRAAREGR